MWCTSTEKAHTETYRNERPNTKWNAAMFNMQTGDTSTGKANTKVYNNEMPTQEAVQCGNDMPAHHRAATRLWKANTDCSATSTRRRHNIDRWLTWGSSESSRTACSSSTPPPKRQVLVKCAFRLPRFCSSVSYWSPANNASACALDSLLDLHSCYWTISHLCMLSYRRETLRTSLTAEHSCYTQSWHVDKWLQTKP